MIRAFVWVMLQLSVAGTKSYSFDRITYIVDFTNTHKIHTALVREMQIINKQVCLYCESIYFRIKLNIR